MISASKQWETKYLNNSETIPEDSINSRSRRHVSTSSCLTPVHKITLKNVVYQIIASCLIQCTVIQAGINMAYSSVIIEGLRNATDSMKVNDNEGSWIASLVTISLPVGSLVVGPLMDKFGRKAICMFSCIPSIISWSFLIAANSLTFIYVARAIAGIAGGLSTVALVYVSEITHPQVRPMLLCLNSVFVAAGILITCCLALWLDWQRMAIVFLLLHCIILLSLFLVPESPYWLLTFKNGMFDENRLNKAEQSFRWLNRQHVIFEQEYPHIRETCRKRFDATKPRTVTESVKHFCRLFVLPNYYKPLTILFFLFLLQQLSGAYVVIFYAISVFQEIGGTFSGGIDSNGALVILGVIRFTMSILTAFLSKRYGRRILCISSGLGMTFSMFFSGMYIYLTSSCDEHGIIKESMANQKWLLLVIVMLYVCMSSLGIMVIPWTLIGELLPIPIRGMGGGLMVSLAYLMMSGVIKSYPYALHSMGAQGVFFFFSFMSLLGTCFVYLFLPETLGKSFTEIEKYFTGNSLDTKL